MENNIIKFWQELIDEMKKEKEDNDFTQSEWKATFDREGCFYKHLAKYDKSGSLKEAFTALHNEYWAGNVNQRRMKNGESNIKAR